MLKLGHSTNWTWWLDGRVYPLSRTCLTSRTSVLWSKRFFGGVQAFLSECIELPIAVFVTTADFESSPHRATEDDVYGEYFIPKGTVVIANLWELNHDPDTYGLDCHEFNPARYLDEKGQLITGPRGTKEDGHFSFGMFMCICLALRR